MIANLSHYRSFLEVARKGSISAAAKSLFVTQPSVSIDILQLENELGVKLFFRTSKGMKLTQAGETLYEYVAAAIGFLENGEDKLREMNELEGGVLRVGASDMTLKFYLLDYLEKFHSEHPRVRLTVSNNPTPRCIEELKNGSIDFCVVSEPVAEDDDIEFTRVKDIRDVMVCSASSYPEFFGGEGGKLPSDVIEFSEILKRTVVMLDRQTSTRRAEEEWMRKCGTPNELLEPEIELATSELLLDFARRGIGIACLVEDFALDDIKRGVLREIPLKTPFPKRNFLLARLKRIPLSSAASQFIDLLQQQ